ncbi:MAG: DUF1579 domain-containing protein [Armatimonadetes bacterium]|nr:DUF1579 domain-containing protein [Armatimonadota bacterium]
MSTETQEPVEMGTKPGAEHEWLQRLVGEWRTEAEMTMGPDSPPMKATGTESVKSMGGLWAAGEGTSTMPDGSVMEYRSALGYDVSFKEYRGCWYASMSSHLWKRTGTLSADGNTMTLDCVGPNMEIDGETANYRDVIQVVDQDHLILTSSGEDQNGQYIPYMTVHYYRTK